MSTYTIETWYDDQGWSARESTLCGIEVFGCESEKSAVDEVIGATLCAIGNLQSPPRQISFNVISASEKPK